MTPTLLEPTLATPLTDTLTPRRHRLPAEAFELEVERIRSGHYSDAYFNTTKSLVARRRPDTVVRMQVFQRAEEAIVGGVDEAIAICRECAGEVGPDGAWIPGWDQLTVRALHEGDAVAPWEPVMVIDGPYRLFAHLETVILGPLARGSLVARNVRRVVQAAGDIPVLFFAGRHDHWRTQAGDGWAASLGGAAGVSTDAGARLLGARGLGTVPHALIAAFGGDTVAAATAFAEEFPDTPLAPLVDFDNDCCTTALAVARALGPRLWGVRLDTSGSLVDRCLVERMGRFSPTGVCPELVFAVREALDAEGFTDVRIVVSGGFKAEKIRRFVTQGVPVDAFGVGSSLLRGENDYTADIVRVDGRPCAKVGREEITSERLELVR